MVCKTTLKTSIHAFLAENTVLLSEKLIFKAQNKTLSAVQKYPRISFTCLCQESRLYLYFILTPVNGAKTGQTVWVTNL
ncbi:MAG: hypothetical protein K0R10_1421 [Alphaproteobacteria bacterium]|nr:hypothetical protein [Alphaproteobacteria bacterium]